MQKLKNNILDYIKRVGLPTDFDLDIRGYSKSYLGRYDPNNKKLVIYALDEYNKLLPFNELVETCIHEAIHHYQWQHVDTFVRYKGVMHNTQFKQLERKYLYKMRKEFLSDKIKLLPKINQKNIVSC